MRTLLVSGAALLALALPVLAADAPKPGAGDWKMNVSVIEACSCPMFCQCFFATKPAGHGGGQEGHEGHGSDHFCRFNNAYKVNKGDYMGTKLDGARFWVYGDLGDDFSDGEMDWAVATFDKSTTQAQRDGIAAILGHIYPVKWKSFGVAEGEISWNSGKDEAWATLDGGKSAEVRLKPFPGAGGQPVVIKNLKYFGVPRNDGFVLMPSTIEALRTGDKPFEFQGTNGFMITLDITSKDVATPSGGSGGGY